MWVSEFPSCPICGGRMFRVRSVDCWFYQCCAPGFGHLELFGIVGLGLYVGFRRLVDPVSMRVVLNPNCVTWVQVVSP